MRGFLRHPATRRWTLFAAGITGLLVTAASLRAMKLLADVGSGLAPVEVEVSSYASGPRNVLVLGSDTRATLSPEEQEAKGGPEEVEGQRSDTIILMHLDPDREKAVVVHFPRDLLVSIPGHGRDRLNAAYEVGGPDLAVRTVKRLTGLEIHNYIEVDFVGFVRLVDGLGGVRMCVDRPLFDELAELDVPEAGCYRFDGKTSLAFVRARHVEGDIIPDFARIGRQQQFMRALLNRLLSVRSLLDPDVIGEAAANLTVDQSLEPADLLYLGSQLRAVAETDPSGASAVDFRVVPSVPQEVEGGSYVVAQEPDAGRLFRALERGGSLGQIGAVQLGTPVSPAVIEVRVLDAGDPDGAAEAESILRRGGFIVHPGRAAPPGLRVTEVLHAPDTADRAEVVAAFFPGIAVREEGRGRLGEADVVVVVAGDLPRVGG
jgi:LCP family protein required for cell wall assembly